LLAQQFLAAVEAPFNCRERHAEECRFSGIWSKNLSRSATA
jgi:hypothetical protein